MAQSIRERSRLFLAELWVIAHPNACPANVYMWAMFDGYDLFGQLDTPKSCAEDAQRCGSCYCGKITKPAPEKE